MLTPTDTDNSEALQGQSQNLTKESQELMNIFGAILHKSQ